MKKVVFFICIVLALVMCSVSVFADDAATGETPLWNTNMKWVPKSTSNVSTEFSENESGISGNLNMHDICFAVSDKYVDGNTSFILEYEVTIGEMTNDNTVRNEGWIQYIFGFGFPASDDFTDTDTVKQNFVRSSFGIFPVHNNGTPHYQFDGKHLALEEEIANAETLSVRFEYISSHEEIDIYVNDEYLETMYFDSSIHEGYIGVASAWIDWTITKAIITEYPDGLPSEQATPVPEATTAPEITNAPETTESPKATTAPTSGTTGTDNAPEKKDKGCGSSSAIAQVMLILGAALIIKKRK